MRVSNGLLLLVERCYVCDMMGGCALITSQRQLLEKARCEECPKKGKPDCNLKVHSAHVPFPAPCFSCSLKTGL